MTPENSAAPAPGEHDPLKLEGIDREIRINRLRNELKDLAGEKVCFSHDENCPPEVVEHFLETVLEIERAPSTTHLKLLSRQGIHLPPPDELPDAELHDKLWELIRGLEKQRTFVYHTNHLSDRQLYTHLWKHSLREWAIDLGNHSDGYCGLDLLGAGSDEDIDLDMKHYADEAERARWQESFPDYQMPPHEDPPFDRDRLLPRRGWPWD
jgi:hypothetical protein